MAKKNLVLLRRLRTRFLRMRHRKHFDMGTVAERTDCGTAMCIAGHTLDLAGYKRKYIGEHTGDNGDFTWFTPRGREIDSAMKSAQKLLGLTDEEAIHRDYDYMDNAKPNHARNGLFMRFDLRTPKQAARAVEKLITQA